MADQPEALRLADAIWPWHKGITCNLSLAAAELRRLHAEVERLRALLQRIRQWDMLGASADGAFWQREIDAVLKEGQQQCS